MKLLLIDGNSYCYRAYYAIRSLSNSKGKPTNAIYGFIAMMHKLIKEESPDMLAVAFDTAKPTFRHKKFEDYKIHRKPMPDDLVEQMPVIKEVMDAYNIPIFESAGFEADDILATIAKRAAKKGIDTFIVTGDKDAFQIVGPHISVYNTHKDGEIYSCKEVQARFGVEPSKVLDVMALAGDASDNIPGVLGIGEKTAVELITQFGSLEELYKNLDKLKSAAKKKLLEENRENANLSKELAKLDCEVPIEVDFSELKLKKPNSKKLISLFKELEFRALLKELVPEGELSSRYKIVDTIKELDRLVDDLEKAKEFALDFETTSSDPMLARVVGLSFCWCEGEAFYVPMAGQGATIEPQTALGKLRQILEDERIKKIGQNIKYEAVILANYGIALGGVAFDTMVASYLLDPSKSNHNLDDLALDYLGHKMTPIEDLIGKGKNQKTMADIEVERVAQYCCEDSDATFRLKLILEKELKKKDLYELFLEVELPLIEVLTNMELAGVCIDEEILKAQSKKFQKKLDALTKDIYEMAGRTFNINSPKQLVEILFIELKLPILKRTKTSISTDERVLKKLSQFHALPRSLLGYRELSKLKSTYIDALPELINPKTKRVHTSFNQTVTATGRLSSSDPNLQNIPIKTEEGRAIRGAFIARSYDAILLSADYSQIELRILAHLSGDENLIKAFKEDLDIHRYTASLIYGIKQDEVRDEMRAAAKTVNFGINYGMSAYGLAQELGIEIEAASKFIKSYFERYPKVKDYIDRQIQIAKEDGFVTTIMNRRRYIPEINSRDAQLRQFAERTAINTPIQGSCADLIKVAMINIHKEFTKRGLKAKMILQVHDELLFELPKSELLEVRDVAREGMENAARLKVPIKVNISTGPNWLDLE